MIAAATAPLIIAGCQITFLPGPGGGGIGGQTTLDRAEAVVSIITPAESTRAQVRLALETPTGAALILNEEQGIEVNGSALREESSGLYTREIDSADTYRFTVREPTRGVETTTISGPGAFSLLNPPRDGEASLSGFTVTWNGADPELDVVVRVSQTIFGDTATRTFTENSDVGALQLSAADLSDFVQGADLTIAVTKIHRGGSINGIGSTTIRIERTRSRTAVPAP
ncbi:MAG: hypothetical protein AB7N71_03140 [Phycisphaerae bacterium]